MTTTIEGESTHFPPFEAITQGQDSKAVVEQIVAWLNEAKSEDIITIDLAGKSSVGDFMVIASGRSARHVGAVADQLRRKFKETGHGTVRLEGTETCDWVILDTGDIIVHIFRPEVREFYNLEKMWLTNRPDEDDKDFVQ